MQPSPLIQDVINGVLDSKRRNMTRGLRAVESRANEFPFPLASTLTGIALEYTSREHTEEILDNHWAKSRPLPTYDGTTTRQEVIIGSGYHAAVYAATRVLSGHPAPLILERNARVGGVFADNHRPAFYLNSRNRPGGPALSGELDGSLNYIPGAPIQPANISTTEYQTNADMALAIRFTLAQYTSVYTNAEVQGYNPDDDLLEVNYRGDTVNIPAARVIDARGLGDPTDKGDGKTVLTFPEFMHRMTGTWPFRGIRRVAVIGAGDSGKCAVEALLGIGPNPPMGSAALDWVERIDWYAEEIQDDCEEWRSNQRSRYQAIGSFLRPDRLGGRRLRVISSRASATPVPGGAYVDGRIYDLVILATGNMVPRLDGIPRGALTPLGDQQPLARVLGNVYSIGPRANLSFSSREIADGISRVPNNIVAMFRLGPKTAALAATLAEPAPVNVPRKPSVFTPPSLIDRTFVDKAFSFRP